MSTFAGRYDEVLWKLVGNRAIPATSATVTVYESDGTTEASLYTDRTKVTAASQPVSPDSTGNLEFFADPGTYVLSIIEDSSVVATNTVVILLDPGEPGAGSVTSVNGSGPGAITIDADDIGVADAGEHYAGAPSQYVTERTALVSGLTVAGGEYLSLWLQRRGGDAEDTLANDAAILGLEVRRAS